MGASPAEPLWFYTKNWYTGNKPNFYDVSTLASTKMLEDNYEAIKKEILDFYDREGQEMRPNFTPYNYKDDGWRTVDVMAFMLKYDKNIEKFPVTWGVVSKLPNVVTMQISMFKPHTRIKAHFGDSNAIVRSHLGIVVPGKYPELGFRNGTKEQCWEEGKVLALCIAHRHYAWNNTDRKRIILLVDCIHPDYADKQLYICASLLASQSLKLVTTKFAFTKKIPYFIVWPFFKIATLGFMVGLGMQNVFKIALGDLIDRIKVDL